MSASTDTAKLLARVEKRRVSSQRAQRDLTARQREILDFIKAHMKKYGYPPTRAEIAYAFRFASTNAAHQHVVLIASKGYLKIGNGARALEVVNGR